MDLWHFTILQNRVFANQTGEDEYGEFESGSGRRTRGMHMLPAQRHPKEMLPIVDKMIQYIVDEIVAAGSKRLFWWRTPRRTRWKTTSTPPYELEALLEQQAWSASYWRKWGHLFAGRDHHERASGAAVGPGHSILCARPVVGDNPFVVLLPDIILDGGTADPLRYNLAALIARLTKPAAAVLAKRIPGDLRNTRHPDQRAYGGWRPVAYRWVYWKPDEPQTSTWSMAVGAMCCRRISGPNWNVPSRVPGRIQLTDAIAELAKKQSVDAMLMTGEKAATAGKKMGYMQASSPTECV